MLPASAYTVIGYRTDNSEEWDSKFAALSDEIEAKREEIWDDDGDEESQRDEYEEILEKVGL